MWSPRLFAARTSSPTEVMILPLVGVPGSQKNGWLGPTDGLRVPLSAWPCQTKWSLFSHALIVGQLPWPVGNINRDLAEQASCARSETDPHATNLGACRRLKRKGPQKPPPCPKSDLALIKPWVSLMGFCLETRTRIASARKLAFPSHFGLQR